MKLLSAFAITRQDESAQARDGSHPSFLCQVVHRVLRCVPADPELLLQLRDAGNGRVRLVGAVFDAALDGLGDLYPQRPLCLWRPVDHEADRSGPQWSPPRRDRPRPAWVGPGWPMSNQVKHPQASRSVAPYAPHAPGRQIGPAAPDETPRSSLLGAAIHTTGG